MSILHPSWNRLLVKIKSSLLIALLLVVAGQVTVIAQRDKRKRTEPETSRKTRDAESESYFTEGMKYFILEDYTKALGAFQRVSEINPDEPVVYYKMAEVYSKSTNAEDLARAATHIEKAIRLDKKNEYFYLLAAEIYAAQNNFSKAEESLELLSKEVPSANDHLYQLAALYIYDKKYDEAVKVYNRAEAVLGVSEVSSLQKMKIYFEQGKMDAAIEEGDKLIAAFPGEERYVMIVAESLSQRGEQRKAIEYLEQYLAAHPEGGASRLLLAGLYHDTGREKESRALIARAMDDPSVDISSKLLVLQTYAAQISQQTARQQQPDTELISFALALYEKMKLAYADDPNVYVAGGNLYIALRRKAEAEVAFLGAIQRGSASFEAWQNLLALEAETGKFDSLIFHSEQGMEIFPNQALLFYFNGYGNLSQQHYREAIASLERAKKLSTANPELVHDLNSMLGDAYNGAKLFAKSDQAFEEALAYKPNDPVVLNNYSYYLSLRKEHLDKAERMAAQVIQFQPNNATYLDTYAWVLYAHDKFKEARRVMEQALALPGLSFVHYEHYGDILFQLGDVDGAVKQWEKARSMTSDHEALDRKIADRRPY